MGKEYPEERVREQIKKFTEACVTLKLYPVFCVTAKGEAKGQDAALFYFDLLKPGAYFQELGETLDRLLRAE